MEPYFSSPPGATCSNSPVCVGRMPVCCLKSAADFVAAKARQVAGDSL